MYLSTNAGNLASSAFVLAPPFSNRNVWNILLPAMSVCSAINCCRLPPFIEIKNRASIWVGFFKGRKTPLTVTEVSPLVIGAAAYFDDFIQSRFVAKEFFGNFFVEDNG